MNEVKEDEHYIADFAYKGSGAGDLFVEAKEDQASALYLDANFEKTFKIDDRSSVFHYELIADNGALNSYMTEVGKGEIMCSDFDGILQEDEIINLPLAVSIGRTYEDHHLDVDFAKKVPDLDCKFYDEFSVDNFCSEIHSPRTSNEEVGVSDSSIQVPQCPVDQFGEVTADEMYGDSGSKCRYLRSIGDKMGLKCSLTCEACNIQDVQETNSFQNTLEIESSFGDYGKKTHDTFNSVKSPYTSIGAHDEVSPASQCTDVEDFCVDNQSTDRCVETNKYIARQRRSCRPPQRYLGESPFLEIRLHNAKKHPRSFLVDKDLGVRPLKKRQRKALEMTAPKAWEPDSDEEYAPVRNRNKVRKTCMPWTLDEVVALVDGMSQFGIGQWTAVKKTFFSSSRRTATDIRDKWRNLVKTNCRSSSKRKDGQRYCSHLLPKTVIERVIKLANSPPMKSGYKRGRKL